MNTFNFCTISYEFVLVVSKSPRPTSTGNVPAAVAKKLPKLVATTTVAHRLIAESEGRETCYLALLTRVTLEFSSALQSLKWQLIGISSSFIAYLLAV